MDNFLILIEVFWLKSYENIRSRFMVVVMYPALTFTIYISLKLRNVNMVPQSSLMTENPVYRTRAWSALQMNELA